MQKLWLIAGLLLIWGIAPGSARAFEKQPAAPAAPQSGLTSPAKKNAEDAGPGKLELEASEDTASSKWRIPGLGSLNILPKMDFGLELLYSDDRDDLVDDGSGGDDVRIRGSVKRRF